MVILPGGRRQRRLQPVCEAGLQERPVRPVRGRPARGPQVDRRPTDRLADEDESRHRHEVQHGGIRRGGGRGCGEKSTSSTARGSSRSPGRPAARPRTAASLQDKRAVTGSLVAMSVFNPKFLPPLKGANGYAYYLYHSPRTASARTRMAEQAKTSLAENGAKVHWRPTRRPRLGGDVYGDLRTGVEWLEKTGRKQQLEGVGRQGRLARRDDVGPAGRPCFVQSFNQLAALTHWQIARMCCAGPRWAVAVLMYQPASVGHTCVSSRHR